LIDVDTEAGADERRGLISGQKEVLHGSKGMVGGVHGGFVISVIDYAIILALINCASY
jgi:acyl-coenzyme A thioesterase PaaI-like protein